MTKTEAKDILINRLDFRATGATPVSGRFFESEHSIVTLSNIRECQPNENITDNDFDTYLSELKTDSVYHVLADVYDTDDLPDDFLECYPAIFDNLLSTIMTVKVIEMIITSQRSNRSQRISKEAAQQLHFDLNGNYGKDSNPNYPRAFGIADKYNKELKRVKGKTQKQKSFVSITTR